MGSVWVPTIIRDSNKDAPETVVGRSNILANLTEGIISTLDV